jgi:hypothetical protein
VTEEFDPPQTPPPGASRDEWVRFGQAVHDYRDKVPQRLKGLEDQLSAAIEKVKEEGTEAEAADMIARLRDELRDLKILATSLVDTDDLTRQMEWDRGLRDHPG